ncbi:MAG: 3'-5' exonuclease [Anaerolineae bacterium]|nr:3'-5' exonuclease [Anaerolineae bacterium]
MSKDWFREQWAKHDFIILDTETTGLGRLDQVCQIGIIDKRGGLLMDTMVKPTVPISSGASRVHGLTDELVARSLTFAEIYDDVFNIISGQWVYVYNASFDKARIQASCAAHGLEDITKACKWVDVMKPYAEFYGDWSSWRQSFTWQSLSNACGQQGIGVVGAHDAVGDCLMTLMLMRKLGKTGH